MDKVLQGLDFCYVYIDDILIASSSSQENFEHTRALFQQLEKFGIVINPTKCVFAFSLNSKQLGSPRQNCHLNYTEQLTTDIRHISGSDNFVADALARVKELESSPHGVKETIRIVTLCFIWPSIRADCRKCARACIECQRS
jgi:hypothetical protein